MKALFGSTRHTTSSQWTTETRGKSRQTTYFHFTSSAWMFGIHLYLQCMGTTSVMLSAARRMRHSPRRNQLNHSHKLFARATKQSNPNTATDATSIGIQLILEGGVPQQPPEHDQPGINKEEQAQNRTERLETQKAKTPAEPFQRHGTGTLIGDPIDLGNLDAADFPI